MKKVIYLWLVKIISQLFGSKHPQKRVVFIQSFANQVAVIAPLVRAAKQNGDEFIVFALPKANGDAAKIKQLGVKYITFSEGLRFVLFQLPQLVQSRLVFVDNYFAFLGGVNLPKPTKVVQLWHANGAIKTFGWQEARTQSRSNSDKKRFQQVYNRMDEIIVGSDKMAAVFQNSYHLPEKRCVKLGYPRSDRLFDHGWYQTAQSEINAAYPNLAGKQVIVYAPTYREQANGQVYFDLPSDFADFVNQLGEKTALIIKLHPHVADVATKIAQKFGTKVICDFDFSTEDWLCVCDCLITDYSSVIFDYAVLPNANKLVFYLYDWHDYQQIVGLQPDMLSWLPGPVVKTGRKLAAAVMNNSCSSDLTKFNQMWNTYNDGLATKRLCERYFATTTTAQYDD